MHAFQLHSSLTRVKTAYRASKPSATRVAVVERSLYSERYCFVQAQAEAGSLTNGEFNILDKWFSMLTGRGDPGLAVDLIVYIKSDPAVLLKRIAGRARKGEDTLSAAYLQELHSRHQVRQREQGGCIRQAWLEGGAFPVPAPVVELDGGRLAVAEGAVSPPGNLELGPFTRAVEEWVVGLPGIIAASRGTE
jgi:hypothetical protein